MKIKSILFTTFLLIVIFSSCKKEEAKEYDAVPEIAFESISPLVVKEFEDSITIVISYKDGDGDLGENNANVNNLFVTDQRINITYPYRVQQLSPDNSTIAIQGKLNVVLKNSGITNGSTSQTVSYKLYIIDRAGHQSNTLTTSSVTIIP